MAMINKLDFTECNQNFINTVKIQPFGYVVIADSETKKITNFSNNIFSLVDNPKENLLNKSIDVILGKQTFQVFEEYLQKTITKKFYSKISLKEMEFEFIGYKLGNKILLEFELVDPSESNFDLENFLINLNTMPSIETLLDFSVKELITSLNYDRVVIYKFKEDWAGEVIEEAKKEKVESLLHLHFPSSDIPEQARLMYLTNRLRMIPDIEYKPELFHHNSLNIEEIKFSPYRDIALHHKIYMKNMGIKASLVGSIITNETLWGLVIFHNHTPKKISIKNRQKIEIIIEKISNQIFIISETNQKINLLNRKNNLKNVFQYFSKASLKYLNLNLDKIKNDFLEVGTADEFYLKYDSYEYIAASLIDREVIQELALNCKKDENNIYTTNSIFSSFQIPVEKLNGFSGICILFFANRENYIIFLRKEQIKEIDWSGNPEEPAIMESKNISPRKSFERWKLLKEHTCLNWTDSELNSIMELNSLEEIFLRLKAETQLIESNEKLKQLDNEKNKFFSILSHDLKSPFSGIIGLSELMHTNLEIFSEEEIKENIKEIFGVSKRIESHLNQLLYYGQLTLGLIKSNRVEFELTALLDKIYNEFSSLAKEREINFQFDYHESILVEADENLIHSILQIFIKNAIKYTPQNGLIKIKYFLKDERLTFSIQDTGIGMDSQMLESIFKLDSKKKNRGVNGEVGVGLGLIISREIANLVKGEIKIISEPQKGTEVFFSIPIRMEITGFNNTANTTI
jgi:chemotaxis family two-component system sensor kinase Cph1